MFSSPDEVNQILSVNFDIDTIAQAGKQRITCGGNSFESRLTAMLAFLK